MTSLKATIAATIADTAGPFPDLADLRLEIYKALYGQAAYDVARMAVRLDTGVARYRQITRPGPSSMRGTPRLHTTAADAAEPKGVLTMSSFHDFPRLRYRLEQLESESNANRMRELAQEYEFDPEAAIADVQGRPPAEVERYVAIIKKHCKKRYRPPKPEEVANAVIIRHQMIEKANRYANEGRKVTAREIEAEIKAESLAEALAG